jgi:RNA polymerase sigma-70 factor (ECF subfamily)
MSLRDRKHVTEENLDDYLPQFDTSGKMKGMAKSIILDPEDETIRGQVRAILEDAIARLPANYRVVLVARDIAELTTEETAEALDLSIAAVKSRLHRARLFLRQRLERKFGKRLSVGEWLKARKM